MYSPGDTVVCPGMGVGKIIRIENRSIGDRVNNFYIIQDLYSSMTIMVPTSGGKIRSLSKKDEIDQAFYILKNEMKNIIENYKGNRLGKFGQELRKGNVETLAKVIKSLFLLQQKNDIRVAEKRLFNECKDLFAKEASVSTGQKPDQILNQIEKILV